MEIWDLYDINRIPTGETMIRGEKIKENLYHLAVHIFIFNKQCEMLIQHRQPFKSGWSDLWDITVGGSAVSGDTSQTAAEREVLEEIGYKLDLSNIRPSFTINFKNGFNDIYLVEREIEIDTLKLQYEEVKEVKWATADEIKSMIESGEFIPYDKSFIDMLFFLRNHNGLHTREDKV